MEGGRDEVTTFKALHLFFGNNFRKWVVCFNQKVYQLSSGDLRIFSAAPQTLKQSLK